MTRLALLRHGHTHWNREGRIQGRSDIPLDAEARAHLARLRLPDPWDKAALRASPLSRAMETAELLTSRPATPEPALIEMNWGTWEGRHGTLLRGDPDSGFRDIEQWGWGYTPPGGESPAALRARLVPWAENLRGDTLAICHIGVMRVLLAHATGWGFSGPAPFQIKRNRLYIIDISQGTWRAEPAPLRLQETAP